MPDPVIITAAVTGSVTAGDQTPHLPTTVEEIVDAAVTSWEAGAAIVHLHARDPEGVPTQDPDIYEELVERIQARGCEAILNLSTGSAGGRADLEERPLCLRQNPEMATLDCGSVNFGDERVFENPYTWLQATATEMKERNVLPEIECFDTGMIANGKRLIAEGLIEGPGVWQLVLGVAGGAAPSFETVSFMLSQLPEGATWSLLGTGRHQIAVNLFSLAFGGHVRTGLEDNIYYSKGVLAKSNVELVSRIVRLAGEVGRDVASPAAARSMLGL